MTTTQAAPRARSERKTLFIIFAAWKAILMAIALGTAMTPSYDTSTSLALDLPPTHASAPLSSPADILSERLTRWDAIYFTSIAKRGYLYEQEWAFGTGLPLVVSQLWKLLAAIDLLPSPSADAAGGPLAVPDARAAALLSILLANTCHLVAVLLLHQLAHTLFPERRIALLAALLHIFSPAGLFLSAPYAESLFACLSFAGYLAYARGCYADGFARGAYQVVAGGLLGLATTCRSNGVLSGLIFAIEALVSAWSLWKKPHVAKALSLVPVLVGGILVGLGTVVPQAVAYRRYCSEASGRPWCEKMVPSIYAFVQKHYWNTGFLAYWTLPNLPLFLLATPVLALLLLSASDCIRSAGRKLATVRNAEPDRRAWRMLVALALGQAALATLTLTSYHVQIITRLASGYPVWYVWVAETLVGDEKVGRNVVRFMVVYAVVQAVLFASFLPPA